jgi:tetratricopeptide (TPR) repeat protein
LACCSLATAAEFQEELITASEALGPVGQQLGEQVEAGQLDQANQRLLEYFPMDKRTPAQTLAVANMLYGLDAKLSYALHKQVAQQLPNEPTAQLEWAMEQHRAGEYAGALKAYDAFSKAESQFAPAHGLAADCLIRLGRTREAVARWQASENASQGTLESLESMVCDVYKDPSLEKRRVDLRARVQRGDVDAAVKLIALDGRYPRDWWNDGPSRSHLEHDVPLLKQLAASPRIKAALSLAECLQLEDPTQEALRSILNRNGWLVDTNHTLPADASTLSLMLGTAISAEVLTYEQCRKQWGTLLLAKARTSKDPDLWNVVAAIHDDPDAMLQIEEQAWKATGDSRFAAGYLFARLKQQSLKPNDPALVKALQQFPEDSMIHMAALATCDEPTEAMLVQAIKAEYRHFSPSGLFPRSSARALRRYFAQLEEVLDHAPGAKAAPATPTNSTDKKQGTTGG